MTKAAKLRAQKAKFIKRSFIAVPCQECATAFRDGCSVDNDTRCMRCQFSLSSRWQHEKREDKKLTKQLAER